MVEDPSQTGQTVEDIGWNLEGGREGGWGRWGERERRERERRGREREGEEGERERERERRERCIPLSDRRQR